MVSKLINNPAGVWGTTGQIDPITTEALNNSAGTLTQGDVVVAQPAGPNATTTATANDKTVIGVVTTTRDLTTDSQAIPIGGPMSVITQGWGRIQIAANAVAAGDILCASAVAKVAVTNNAATAGMAIGIALEASGAKDANNTIRALIGKM